MRSFAGVPFAPRSSFRPAGALLAAILTVSAAWPLRAADLPSCNDPKALHAVRMQYDMAEQALSVRRTLSELTGIREVSTGAPPAAANQYATATSFIEISRYCEANAKLEEGESEPVFWRIDRAKDGAEERIRFEHCSKRHDAFKDGCKWFRPGS